MSGAQQVTAPETPAVEDEHDADFDAGFGGQEATTTPQELTDDPKPEATPEPTPAPAPALPPLAARSTAPAADPFLYFVQAGAFTRSEDAEQQKARLALMGQGARITEREQSGRTVYRVRIGPLPSRDEADALQGRLHDGGIEAQIVRVERP